MKCVNGHSVSEGGRYCSECGGEVVPPGPRTRLRRTMPASDAPTAPSEPEQAPTGTDPEGTEPARRRFSKPTKRHARAATLVLLCAGGLGTWALTTSRNSEPGVETFMCSFADGDLLLQWPSNGNKINGTTQSARLVGSGAERHTEVHRATLAGRLSGNAISLKAGATGTKMYGSLHGDSLTIDLPVDDGTIQKVKCERSSVKDWNREIAALGNSASEANQRASLASAKQRLTTDLESLVTDTRSLESETAEIPGEISAAHDHLNTEKADLSAVQKTGDSNECSDMYDALQTVYGDHLSVSDDTATIDNDAWALSNDAKRLKTGAQSLRQDADNVRRLGGSPRPDVRQAIERSSVVAKAATAAANKALAETKALEASAQSIEDQADQSSTSQGC